MLASKDITNQAIEYVDFTDSYVDDLSSQVTKENELKSRFKTIALSLPNASLISIAANFSKNVFSGVASSSFMEAAETIQIIATMIDRLPMQAVKNFDVIADWFDNLAHLFIQFTTTNTVVSLGSAKVPSIDLALKYGYLAVKSNFLDYQDFAIFIDMIDWDQQSSSTFALAIGLTISLDKISLARRLSESSLQLYPEDAELQKLAKVLAPPKVVRNNLPANPKLALTMQWLQDYAHQYKGLWVAVRDGQLLGSNQNRKLLLEEISTQFNEDTLITRIFG